MIWLKDKIYKIDEIAELGRSLTPSGRTLLKNAPGSLPVLIASFLTEKMQRPVLMVCETLEDAEEVADDLTVLLGDRAPCLLPGLPAYGRALTAIEQSERVEVLLALQQGEHPLVVTTAGALLDPLPDKETVSASVYTITKGETLQRESLLEYLISAGYHRELFVEAVGQVAIRGAVIDIYPFGKTEPVRLEFFDDEIESIRSFDPATQKSTSAMNEITLAAAEFPEAKITHLLAHLPDDTVILWDEGRACWNEIKKSYADRGMGLFAKGSALGARGLNPLPKVISLDEGEEDFNYDEIGVDEDEEADDALGDVLDEEEEENDFEEDEEEEGRPPLKQGGNNRVFPPGTIRMALKNFTQVFLETSFTETDKTIDLSGLPQERFAANLPLVADRLKEYKAQGIEAVILSDSQIAGDRLAQVLIDRDCPEDAFTVREGGLHHGFTLPKAKFAVLVDHDIFGRMRRRRRFMKFKNVTPLHDIDSLKPGDFVVHIDYGIGKYQGLTKIKVGNVQREVLKIIYKDNVNLFVKLENLSQIQKYSGKEGFEPPLSKIGGKDWKELKKKTKTSLMSIAEDLIKLYAQRKVARGQSFSPDTAWQREMEAMFPYEDTPDQQKAAEDVKHDMEKESPMDRLVVGDVGYGKTEVAIRAAFKAVTDGKQVAVLVPTTILAQQHYRTFKERLKNWPVKVGVISRFQSTGEQRSTIKKLSDGDLDILIGTHRMLSKDVQFKDIGLLIVDEEHRFGVVQKEKLKSLRSNVDVLSMSATPIPRTLHMSLMGARDLSQINTPPPNRQPIETDVVPFSDKVIKDAILFEVQRGGQVFFIHNRVQSIGQVQKMLERLLPNVRFTYAHGQMEEDTLAKVMVDFIEGRFDVLVSTMIVESGLDLPNVNTMIVNRADKFGVAQLHQLRGRIGRSSRKAYAYLLVPPGFEMTKIARDRLAALTNFSSLGAGFQVAMRDLEIRGAGNLLGREQSGYINAIGFEMYQRLIEEAVHDVKVEQRLEQNDEKPPVELKLEVATDAFFPETYMSEGGMRLNFYRELAKTKELSQVQEIQQDILDRFGRLPEPAKNLFDMVRIRILGERLGAEKLSIQAMEMRLEFSEEIVSREKILEFAAKSGDYPVEFGTGEKVMVKLPLGMMLRWEEKLQYVMDYLGKIGEMEKIEA